MQNNQFTEKSREALGLAQQMTVEYQNQEMAQEHLIFALLSDEKGLIPQLLTKMGKDPREIRARMETLVARMPKVTGSGREPDKIYINSDLPRNRHKSSAVFRNKSPRQGLHGFLWHVFFRVSDQESWQVSG